MLSRTGLVQALVSERASEQKLTRSKLGHAENVCAANECEALYYKVANRSFWLQIEVISVDLRPAADRR